MIIPGTISPYELDILKGTFYGAKDNNKNSSDYTGQHLARGLPEDSRSSEGLYEDGVVGGRSLPFVELSPQEQL